MGTRFLMAEESPVPRSTLSRYVAVSDPSQIRVSAALDGLPQRMIDNPYLLRLEAFGPLRPRYSRCARLKRGAARVA